MYAVRQSCRCSTCKAETVPSCLFAIGSADPEAMKPIKLLAQREIVHTRLACKFEAIRSRPAHANLPGSTVVDSASVIDELSRAEYILCAE